MKKLEYKSIIPIQYKRDRFFVRYELQKQRPSSLSVNAETEEEAILKGYDSWIKWMIKEVERLSEEKKEFKKEITSK